MMGPTIQLLRELGVPGHQIKSEAFIAAPRVETTPAGSAATAPRVLPPMSAAGDSSAPTLTFGRSAKSVPLAPEKTLLEISEAAGVSIDFECRSGICGRCKTKLLAGSVTMEVQDALDEADKSRNIILLCQAKATDHVTIEA
jgi:ferredoxin